MRLSQQALELGEGELDGIDVWGVGRQIPQGGPSGFDELLDPCHLVGGQIVHYDDVAGPQGRSQDLLDIGQEDRAIHRLVDDEGGGDSVMPERPDEGGHFPMTVRHRSQQPLTARRPSVAPGHVGRCPGFIKEDQAGWVQRRLLGSPGDASFGYVGTFLLGSMRTLFFRLRSSRSSVFHRPPTLIDTPNSARTQARNSASVASGSTLICACNASR
uniref:Transposase n=1 Tax=Magnetospirillum gryphiswaldense TaxID=55518 RepID=Q3BKC3_9PROT|nr:putative transposase [Magnetospirillum gryphiswaldense MSR-1]CAM78012.1 transposase [Magnetospirillum gryphiswaldense MSR-1]